MKSIRLMISALLSGVMLSMAWLGFSGLILFIAFIPLLFVEESILHDKIRYKSLHFWGHAFLSFFVWNILTTWWIWHATPVGAMAAIVINSLLMSIVWDISHIISRQKGKVFGHLFLFFLWISFEYLHYRWDMSWPWLTLGNGLANDVKLIQWYEYTGVFGGTAWILGVNLLLYHIIRRIGDSSRLRIVLLWIILLLLICIPVIFSLFRYSTYVEKQDPIEIVNAQPNIDPYNDKFGGMSYEEQLDRLLYVSDSIGSSSVDFFIGPETALHEVWENNPLNNRQLFRIQKFISEKYPKAAFVVGASAFRRYYTGERLPSTVRYSADSTIIYDAFNAACLIEKDGNVEFYKKTKLVSGVEKMPFEKYLRFLGKIIIDLGGTTGTLGTMPDTIVFKHGRAIVGVPICYESGYGEYISRFVNKGANVFFVITNDGWWKNTPGYRQHLSYSCLRAIEFRRSIARSANTGISCFIDQRGSIIQRSSWWEFTSLRGRINLNDEITFYARHGDYIGKASMFTAIMMFLIYLVGMLIKKTKQRAKKKKTALIPVE